MKPLILIAFVLLSHYGSAQTRQNFTTIKTVDKGDYFYIPSNALKGSFQGIVHQDKTLRKPTSNKQPIELYWISTCNDGYYIMTITPEQIFFSSSHENPNPNFLFWVLDINPSFYESIKQELVCNTPKGFENVSKYYKGSKFVFLDKYRDNFPIPDTWTESQLMNHIKYCKTQINNQINRYLSIINTYSTSAENKISAPKMDLNGRLFSTSEAEISDWLPVKVER